MNYLFFVRKLIRHFCQFVLVLIASVSFQAVANSSLSCDFTILNNWGSGAIANLNVSNTSTATVTVDPITMEFTDTTRVVNGWNAEITGSNPYTMTLSSNNSQLSAGESLDIGLQLTIQSQVASPLLGGGCSPEIIPPVNQPPSVSVTALEGLTPGLSKTFFANASDADGNLTNWELAIYQSTIDGPQNPVVIDSGVSTGTGNVSMSGNWSTNNTGSYVLVAQATDSEGETASASDEFAVAENPEGTIQLNVATNMRVGSSSSATLTTWHPTIMGTGGMSIQIQPNVADLYSQPSSSSGGPSIGYTSIYSVSFRPVEAGTHTFTGRNTLLGLEIVKTADVQPTEPLPTVSISAPATATTGDLVDISVTGGSTVGISALELSIDGVLQVPTSSTAVTDGRVNAYQWTAVESGHTLSASVTDANNNSADAQQSILVEAVSTGDCIAQGIDPVAVNTYPDWPRLDWKGDPHNAIAGDMMQHQGVVYSANWWTTSIPGSDHSWEFVCNI